MSSEKPSSYYDDHFEKEHSFRVHYRQSFYYVHWTQVIVFLRKIPDPVILEIGCGTGQFAEYLKDEKFTNYRGFDFSQTAIDLARKRVSMNFLQGNALDPTMYAAFFNTVICLEVLEHIEADLQILKTLPEGVHIIFSVPNFDAPSHVRWFTSERELKKRYFKHVDIREIVRVGNIFLCRGIVKTFSPTFLQMFFATRERVGFASFSARFKHRVKNILKIKTGI